MRRTKLQDAVTHGDLPMMRKLLCEGVELRGIDKQGRTALHYAAMVGNVEAIQLLCAAGAELEAREDVDDHTPLYTAAYHSTAEAVTALLEAGADIDAVTYEPSPEGVSGISVMVTAKIYNSKEVCDVLRDWEAKT